VEDIGRYRRAASDREDWAVDVGDLDADDADADPGTPSRADPIAREALLPHAETEPHDGRIPDDRARPPTNHPSEPLARPENS
jgi:hypothetical protein